MWMTWLEQEEGTGDWRVALAVLALMALAFCIAFVRWSRKRRRIDAWLSSMRFRAQAVLPLEMRPGQSVWQPETTTQRIFRGVCNGYDCVLFEVNPGGENGWWTVIAVERSWREGEFTHRPERLGAKLDRISAPEWLMARVSGSNLGKESWNPFCWP